MVKTRRFSVRLIWTEVGPQAPVKIVVVVESEFPELHAFQVVADETSAYQYIAQVARELAEMSAV